MEWVTKFSRNRSRRKRYISDRDVTINAIKIGFSFIFRNSVSDKWGGALAFARVNNRIYFKGAESNEGYVLIDTPRSLTNRYVHIVNYDDVNFLNDFLGDYVLQYDVENDLYFIENKSLKAKERDDNE